jgi:surfeit locus 1 family protein
MQQDKMPASSNVAPGTPITSDPVGPGPGTAGGKARPSRGRVMVALVLLAITVFVCVSLGRWQVARGKEKAALLAQVEDGKRQAPLQLVAATQPEALTAWRPASASGQWLPGLTVLLDNRTAGGRPGFWVVTPLRLDNSSEAPTPAGGYTGGGPVVLVLRGWLPRQFPDQPLSAVPTPTGQVKVSGTVLSHIPRLFELSSLGAGKAAVLPERLPVVADRPGSQPADGPLPRVQNLDIAAFARASGLTVLPAVLQSSQSDGSLVQDWKATPANTDMHRGYALQWFSFAAIAAIAFGVLLVRHLRFSRR